MSIKADRQILRNDVSKVITTAATQGDFCIHDVAGSGAAIGDTYGKVKVLSTNPSGAKFAGVVMENHVSLDTTKYDLNQHKSEKLINDVADLCTQGYVVTDNISGTPTVGATAYLASAGKVSPTDSGGCPKVGYFDSIKDELGFAKVVFDTTAQV